MQNSSNEAFICIIIIRFDKVLLISGGLILKRPGRVGQAALYASGVWADSFDQINDSCIAVCTTGCGEHLVQTQLAKEIGEDLKHHICPTTALHTCMTEKFLSKQRRLRFLVVFSCCLQNRGI